MKKTLSWLMVLLMVFSPFAATVINASAEVPNQDNTVIASDEQTPVDVDSISTTMASDATDLPYEVVVVHPEGGHFTGGKENYPTLNVTLQKERKKTS